MKTTVMMRKTTMMMLKTTMMGDDDSVDSDSKQSYDTYKHALPSNVLSLR